MAHGSSHRNGAQSFDIFNEDWSLTKDKHVTATAGRRNDVLRELSHGQSQSRVTPASDFAAGSPLTKSPQRDLTSPENKTLKTQSAKRPVRVRRPQVDAETFEPLGAVPEETSSLIDEDNLVADSPTVTHGEVKGKMTVNTLFLFKHLSLAAR